MPTHLEESARLYSFNYSLSKKLAADGSLKILFVLQPTLFTKGIRSEYERWQIHEPAYSLLTMDEQKDLWNQYRDSIGKVELKEDARTVFLDLSFALAGIRETVYYARGDWLHTNWLEIRPSRGNLWRKSGEECEGGKEVGFRFWNLEPSVRCCLRNEGPV